MAFRHGKSTSLLFGGYDLSRFFNQSQVSHQVETADTTTYGADGSAKTYIVGHRDATLSAGGLYDGAEDAVDEVISGVLGADADQIVTLAPDGLVVGRRCSSAAVKSTSYEISSPVADVVSVSLEVQANGGADPAVVLAAGTAATATGNGTAVDNAALSSNGGVGYLHVTGNTHDGNSTVKIQHSVDNSVWVDLITFAVVATTVVSAERVLVAEATTVNRYLRATHTLAGSSGTTTYSATFSRR